MNKSYKSIWNEALGTYVAAAETAVASGRKTSSRRRARRVPARDGGGLLALEPRIVFDAAIAATVTDVDTETSVLNHQNAVDQVSTAELASTEEPAAPASVEPATETSSEEGASSISASTDQVLADSGAVAEDDLSAIDGGAVDSSAGTDATAPSDTDVSEPSDSEASAVPEDADLVLDATGETAQQEIIFVDAVVPDIADFLQNHPGEVIYLEAGRDGVEQIAEALQGRTGVTAVHILGHAESGQVRLGSSLLTADSIQDEHADDMEVIRAALAADADILLYGCDIAADAAGLHFVQALADATGADVAASDDTTGADELGGNWTLEVQHGQIDAQTLAVTAWHGVLAQNNTGAWTITGTTASQGSTASAATTTAGVTTTVSFSSFSTATTNVTGFVGGTTSNLNGIAVFNSDGGGAVQGTPSLTFQYNWDSTPEGGGTLASTGGGTALMTITFSQPVTNPVLHLDRIGGTGGGVHNGMTFTMQKSGLSLVRLSGTDHFSVVGGNVIRNSQVGAAVGTGYTAESSTNINLGTAAGSVLVNGTNVTSITFLMSFDAGSVEGLGGDAIELKVSLDPAPIARNDAFTTAEDTAVSGNLFASNGSGADTDINSDPLTVTAVNGVVVTGGVPISLANGTLTITNPATGAFTFVPNQDYNGTQSFNYTISDPRGSTSTASVNITVTPVNDAPVNTVPPAQVVAEDSTVVFSAANGNAISVADVDNGSLTVTVWAEQGTLTISGTAGLTITRGDGISDAAITLSGTVASINAALNGLVFQPTSDNNGAGAVNIRTSDGSATTVSRVAIDLTPVDDTTADSVSTTEATPVDITPLVNDSFEGPAYVVSASDPANGTAVVNADGTITYTPDAGFGGEDTFTYTTATLDEGFNYSYWSDNPTSDSPNFATVFPAGFPTRTPDGTGWTPGISGGDSLLVQAEQGDADTNNVVAWSGEFLVLEAGTYTFNLDADNTARLIVDGSVAVTTNSYSTTPTSVTLTLDAGVHTFVVQYADLLPNERVNLSYSGADTSGAAVNVNGSDLWGAKVRFETETVTVDVYTEPRADSSSISVNEGSENTPLGLSAPTDLDGDTLTITVTGLPILGTVTLSDGSPVTNGQLLTEAQLTGLQYDAPADYNGTDPVGSFAYTVSDGVTTVSGGTVIDVSPVDDQPVAANDTIAVTEDTPASGSLALNDTPSGDGGNVWALGSAP
ncbi:MAG: DUF4347 domain-containing protein, partial [Pseudomonadota bacterium]